MKMNEIQFWNYLPKLVDSSQDDQYGVVAQNFGFLKMYNFDIYVVHLSFRAILGDPKFGSFHVGHHTLLSVTATLD